MKKILFILCLLPVLGYSQIIRPTPNIIEANPGPFIHFLTFLNAFTTNAGTASASQSFSYTTGQLSTDVVWTAGSGMEICLTQNGTYVTSLTATGSATAGTYTLWVRVAQATTAGSYSGNISGVSSPAPTANMPYSATVNAVPTLNVSPNTLSGFTSTAGNLGGSQSYSLTGSALTGTITVTPPSGYKVSKDNSTFTTSTTVTPSSGAINQTIYAALSDANTAGSYSGNITNSGGGATAQNVAVSGTTTAPATTPDSARFQFDTTTANDVAGWTIVRGDPSKHVISGTVGSTTITYTTVSTSTSNWAPFCSPCASTGINNGVTNATIPYTGSTGVMREAAFTTTPYQTTNAQFISGGWKTDGTLYDVIISGTTQFGFAAVGSYTVRGATLSSNQPINGASNTSTQSTWTSMAPDASGNFSFYFGPQSGNQIALVSFIIIRKH